MSVPTVLNISAYRFVGLDDLPDLRAWLLVACRRNGLLGTVLLAPEGINLFIAGAAKSIAGFLGELRSDPRFADLRTRESWSVAPPFRRLLVKVRPEIITMRRPAVCPAQGRAPAVSATVLKRWLDDGVDDHGRPVVTLDTRNAFEVDYGHFAGCIDLRIGRFGDFPAAVEASAALLEGRTVVTYCTGGIRCEKAAIVMREAGIDHVHQLDGGILGYFEAVGGAHWQGECFVFDDREALKPTLSPRRG